MNILIFKTNLDNHEAVQSAGNRLQQLAGIHRWNVDMQDCDHVLRIEAGKLTADHVETLLREAGYYCEEMKD
ncbi:MAG TPA: hypothetical protein VG842_03005 [Sediminibacterium sp.]|nr:hypothetical protein [Sediminibacterium sp.]